ncbi:MAG TPA: hypothetical protein PKJ99_02580 [Thermoanaerobaculales bacterium]|nr:hypothetical protein [Thermoanaerobaculales bacterium]
MKRTLQMVVLIGAGARLVAAGAGESRALLVYGSDVLGVPGAAVTLSVGVEEAPDGAGFGRPVAGEAVEFLLYAVGGQRLADPAPIGTAETDGEGRATLGWSPKAWSGPAGTGSFEVGARLARVSVVQARMEVVVPPAERPLLLVKLDVTRSVQSDAPGSAVKSVEGSGSTVLLELAERNQLVYLSEVEGRAAAEFKAWMKRRGLPPGPVLLLADDAASLSPEERHAKRVRELVQANPRIAIGLGATAADARAFVASGLAAVIVPADLDAVGELPDGAFATSSWASAYAALRQCEMSGELLRNLGRGGEEAREAQRRLERLGRAGAACVDRLREDPEFRSAAIYVSGMLRGGDGLWAAVDVSSSDAVRDSLLAAWRFGDPSVIEQLYDEPPVGEADPVPAFDRWESLGEPRDLGAAGVVHTVRLTGEDGMSGTYEITCVRQPDATWRIRGVEPASGVT